MMAGTEARKLESQEFYIGWQPQAPTSFRRRVRGAVFLISLLVVCIGIAGVANQSGFSSSAFEYGQATEITGELITTPAPFVRVFRGEDFRGDSVFQYILLVGAGKHGVNDILLKAERSKGKSLAGSIVHVKGFLIYHDGKTLMEVEEMKDIQDIGKAGSSIILEPHARGTIIGEITDPKCLFGVMKPGYGKPHRSCAARCIAGGIPPVLKVVSTTGDTQYFILDSGKPESIGQEVLPFVGDQVAICGDLIRMGEWMILRKSSGREIQLVTEGPMDPVSGCR